MNKKKEIVSPVFEIRTAYLSVPTHLSASGAEYNRLSNQTFDISYDEKFTYLMITFKDAANNPSKKLYLIPMTNVKSLEIM